MKKILSLILAALMTASCAAFVAADDAANEIDTTTNEGYAIDFLAEYGIFKGVSSDPDVMDAAASAPIQRYQMALFVGRISTGWVEDYQWEDHDSNTSGFADIEEGAAANYKGAISYASEMGIIEGRGNGVFDPYGEISYRDALTMVVRTLGWNNLSYPWGYIQQAVSMGLTEDVVAADGGVVAYTDTLNRGQVAVIIYNALFCENRNGETLAKSIFDVDFDWKNIMIVSSDRNSFKTEPKVSGGYVGVKILDDNYILSDVTYLVPVADLKLEGHEDEIEVGAVYAALFESIDGVMINLVDAKSLELDPVWNLGRTNDLAEPQDLAILAAKGAYSLVKSQSENNKFYINWTLSAKELFVFTEGTTTYYVEGQKKIAIDWANGNILEEVNGEWKIAWYYYPELNKYYEIKEAGNGDAAGHDVLINWMSQAEFEKWYKTPVINTATTENYVVADLLDTDNMGKTAYAKLRLFDVDGANEAAKAEVALYKEYGIGIISMNKVNCAACNKDVDAYKIVGLNDKQVMNVVVDHAHAGAWINLAPSAANMKNEDGSYKMGTIVYNYNKSTGEIEIVKYIDGETDADSYWTSGVLQGYSTRATSITLDGDVLYYGYDNLIGREFSKGDGKYAAREKVGNELDEYLMQYVDVLVVDGLVVDVDLKNSSKDVIVVLGYAGVSNDGYICVYGYDTKDVNGVNIYKINSFNGWKQGDLRYYPTTIWDNDYFEIGAVYTIKSYDADTESYGVYTQNTEEARDDGTLVSITVDSGYRIVETLDVDSATGEWVTVGTPAVEPMKSTDTYIIIGERGDIYVENGVLTEDYAVTGYKLPVSSGAIVVFADMRWGVEGFNENAHEVGFVLFEDDRDVLEAHFDAAIGDWYLLGSTMSEVAVRNLLTGAKEYIIASSNIDLDEGCVYMTIGVGSETMILRPSHDDCIDFLYDIGNFYSDDDADTADYIVKYVGVTKTDIDTDLELASILGLMDDVNTTNETILGKIADAKIGDCYGKFSVVDGDCVEISAASMNDNTQYDLCIIYNPSNAKYVVYVMGETAVESSPEVGR